jgi:hypothetical protein
VPATVAAFDHVAVALAPLRPRIRIRPTRADEALFPPALAYERVGRRALAQQLLEVTFERLRLLGSLAHMPHWLPPFAAAASAVLVLNIALMVQRVREQSKTWPARFLRDLRRWDGRLPDDLDQHVHT